MPTPRHLANIYRLGIKELWSLWRDPMMLFLIGYTFTVAVYTAGTAMPETLHRTPIAIVDEDDSALSARIIGAFYLRPPKNIYFFLGPIIITIWRPSSLGYCSTVPNSAKSASTRLSNAKPISWWAISRPRKRRVILALSPSERKRVRLRSLTP